MAIDPPTAITYAAAMISIQYHLDKIAGKVFRKQGFATAKIIMEWDIILDNPEISKHATPIKITYPVGKNSEGTLHIAAPSALSPELLQYEPKIVEKIAQYFGFKAISRIKIVHRH